MGRQEAIDAADAIAVFDFGVEGMFVPVASGTLQGAGFYDTDQAVSRLATPLDFAVFQSVTPPTGWDQFHTVIDQITTRMLAQGALDEMLAWAEGMGIITPDLGNGRREITFGLHLMFSHPGDFATGAGLAYSEYIESQARSYLDLVVKGLPWMFNAYVCGSTIRVDLQSLTAMVEDHLRGQSGSQLDLAISGLETWIAGHPPPVVPGVLPLDCSGVLDALKLLRTAVEAFVAARDWLTQDINEIYEDFGYVALFIAETLRSREFLKAIAEAVGVGQPDSVRAEKIGAIYGTLVGVVIWEIIEEVVTAGFGKGARVLKVLR